MPITIITNSPEPIFRQIHHQIVAAVARGELKPGDRIQSVRALAQALAVNPATVVKAYDLLKEEGIIESPHRGKTVVATPRPISDALKDWDQQLGQVLALGLAEGMALESIRASVERHLSAFSTAHAESLGSAR